MSGEPDRPTSEASDPLNPLGMPAREVGSEMWQPKRGPVFKTVVWALLVLIGVVVIAGLVTGLVF